MRLTVLIYLMVMSVAATAQSVQQTTPQVYETQQSLKIRTSPPSRYLNLPGRVRGLTGTQTPYVVLQSLSIQQGFSHSQWAEIAPVTSEGQIIRSASGWIVLPQQNGLANSRLSASHRLSAEAIDQLTIELRQ